MRQIDLREDWRSGGLIDSFAAIQRFLIIFFLIMILLDKPRQISVPSPPIGVVQIMRYPLHNPNYIQTKVENFSIQTVFTRQGKFAGSIWGLPEFSLN
jgi:hypothetical protein